MCVIDIPYTYVVIFERQNLRKSFVDHYYGNFFRKLMEIILKGTSHVPITKFLFSKMLLSFSNFLLNKVIQKLLCIWYCINIERYLCTFDSDLVGNVEIKHNSLFM